MTSDASSAVPDALDGPKDAGQSDASDAAGRADAEPLGPCPAALPARDRGTGLVQVAQWDYPGGAQLAISSAAFPDPGPIPEPDPTGCIGSCVVGQRYAPDAGARDVGSILAGEITISGLRTGTVTLLPPTYSQTENGRAFGLGESMRARASGEPGGVPAFAGSLETPPTIATTLPSSADRAADLLVEWTVASTTTRGVVEIEILGATRGRIGHGIEGAVCTFPIASRSGVVPSAALSEFEAGEAGLTLRVRSSTIVPAGDHNITLEAQTILQWGSRIIMR